MKTKPKSDHLMRGLQMATGIAPAKSRRDQNAELYRKHGWHLQLGTKLAGDRDTAVEFWIKEGSCHQSVVVIQKIPRSEEQHIENFFQGGGHTWEELEAELARDPKAVRPSRDALLDLLGFVRWCIDNGKSNLLASTLNHDLSMLLNNEKDGAAPRSSGYRKFI